MNVLSLPVEVIEGHLLPFLKWNDLLRFRRVCKLTKAITDGYLKIHPDLAPEMEIDEEAKNFGAFLKMNVPSTKIHLKNVSGREFFERNEDDVELFLEEFGPVIKSLRLHQLSLIVYGKELKFLNSLVNLKTLEVGHLGYRRKVGGTPEECLEHFKEDVIRFEKESTSGTGYSMSMGKAVTVPKVVENLQVLKIGQEEDTLERMRGLVDSAGGVYLACVWNAVHVSVPFTLHSAVRNDVSERFRIPRG